MYLYVNDLSEPLRKTAHILQYSDKFLIFCSDKKS